MAHTTFTKPNKMVAMKLSDILDDDFYSEIETNPDMFEFLVNYSVPEGSDIQIQIYEGYYFLTTLYSLFANRLCMVDKDNAGAFFYDLYDNWRTTRNREYAKFAYALQQNYNPIQNYDMLEVMTDDVTVHERETTDTQTTTPYDKEETTHTPFTKETMETTPYNSETTTTTPEDTTTNSKSSFNSATLNDTDKTTRGGQITEVLEKDGTEKIERTFEGTEKHTLKKTGTEEIETAHTGADTDTRNYTLTRAGNLGVQTAADMLEKEYNLLKEDLAFRALSEFFDKYTFYAEGVVV